MESHHLLESRSGAPWKGGAVAIGAAALVLIALLLVADRHGPGSAMPTTDSVARETLRPIAPVASTAVPFDVSSRMLPDEWAPPAKASDGDGPRP